MGLQAPQESRSALVKPDPDHLDCESIHKGVATRAIWNLAASAPRWSVAHCSVAAALPPLCPSPATPGLLQTFDYPRDPDWSQ